MPTPWNRADGFEPRMHAQTDSGLVLTVLLKTSRRPLARQTAAQCLLRLVQHLAPEERFISHAHALPLNVARPKPVRPQLVDF